MFSPKDQKLSELNQTLWCKKQTHCEMIQTLCGRNKSSRKLNKIFSYLNRK